jgi:hypothetical protein
MNFNLSENLVNVDKYNKNDNGKDEYLELVKTIKRGRLDDVLGINNNFLKKSLLE